MNTNLLPLLAQRVFNRPLLIHPGMADALYGVLDGRINFGSFAADILPPTPEASQFKGTRTREDGTRRTVRATGKTALITIDGSLVNRGAWMGKDFCTGLVSYEGINAQLDEVAVEAGIENVILDINSYGGEANGMAGTARKVRELRKTKYVIAVINDVAASAGYGIASGADEIVVSETSVAGSIGVVMLHLDRSAEMAAKGVRPTFIHAGAHKVDGHPFGPLPESVRSDMQRDVMAFYDQFLGVVEAGRGKPRLNVKKARETEARTFIGQAAVDAGLADRVGSLDDVLAELSKPRPRGSSSKPSNSPRSKAMLPTEANNEAPVLNAADHAAIAAEYARLNATAETARVAAAAAAAAPVVATPAAEPSAADERARVLGIIGLPEAKGRTALAEALIANGTSLEGAKSILAAAPLASTTPAPDQRQNNGAEMGANGEQVKPSAEQVKTSWAKAFNRLS